MTPPRTAWRVVASVVLCLLPAATVGAQPVCHRIGRGESAAQIARRLTGNPWNAYRPWFEIRNAASRQIPKSQYDRIRPGWQACITRPAAPSAPVSAARMAAAEAPLPVPSPAVLTTAGVPNPSESDAANDATTPLGVVADVIGRVDLLVVWLGAAMVVPWFGWRILDGRLARTRTATILMQHFATRFVREFERPLISYDGERPLRSKVRYSTRRRRFEILLAPGKGHRYPNLSDHKKNVEYDVARVVNTLGDASFVNGAPGVQSEWVVIPFQFKPGTRQSGATCISSL